MMRRLRTYWHLFWHFRRLQLMRMMEMRANFFFWVFVTTIWGLFNLLFMNLLVQSAGGKIAGWNQHELYLLVGVFTMSDALMWSAMYHNMVDYSNHIFRGTLSGLLLKPVDTQFVLMVQNSSYSNALRFVLGLAIVIHSLRSGAITPSLTQVSLFLSMFAIANIFLFFLWFMLSTLAFWVERLDNMNEIIPNIQRLWRFPRSIYTGILSTILTVILPLGLISSVPAEALLGKLDLVTAIYFSAFTLATIWLSRIFFRFSLRRFGSVGD